MPNANPAKRITSEKVAEELTFIWLKSRDLSKLQEPSELVAMFADAYEKIKKTVLQPND